MTRTPRSPLVAIGIAVGAFILLWFFDPASEAVRHLLRRGPYGTAVLAIVATIALTALGRSVARHRP